MAWKVQSYRKRSTEPGALSSGLQVVSVLFLLLLLLHRFSRVPCPWDSPGKNTGVGCHFLLQGMEVKSESEVAQSCLTLSNPMDCSPPGSSVHGIFQARVLDSSLSNPRQKSQSWGFGCDGEWQIWDVLYYFCSFNNEMHWSESQRIWLGDRIYEILLKVLKVIVKGHEK